MKMKHANVGICERRLVSLKPAEQSSFLGNDGDYLKPLGGFRRTQESTIGAVGNIIGGTGELLRGRLLHGPARIGLGVFDGLDFFPSALADWYRSVMGTESVSHSPSRTNIGRAFSHFGDIDTSSPVQAIKDTTVATVDAAHALLFKPVSDILRLLRSSN
jgi:hypothetical protein